MISPGFILFCNIFFFQFSTIQQRNFYVKVFLVDTIVHYFQLVFLCKVVNCSKRNYRSQKFYVFNCKKKTEQQFCFSMRNNGLFTFRKVYIVKVLRKRVAFSQFFFVLLFSRFRKKRTKAYFCFFFSSGRKFRKKIICQKQINYHNSMFEVNSEMMNNYYGVFVYELQWMSTQSIT